MNCSSSASTKNESASQAPSCWGSARSPTIRRAVMLSASSSALDSHDTGEPSERKARSHCGAYIHPLNSRKPSTAISSAGATPVWGVVWRSTRRERAVVCGCMAGRWPHAERQRGGRWNRIVGKKCR